MPSPIAIAPNRSEQIRKLSAAGLSPDDIRAQTGWPLKNIKAAIGKKPRDQVKTRAR